MSIMNDHEHESEAFRLNVKPQFSVKRTFILNVAFDNNLVLVHVRVRWSIYLIITLDLS